MNSPYTQPKAKVTDQQENSPQQWTSWVFPLLALGLSIVLGLFGAFGVPAFGKVLIDFGADLTGATVFVLSAGKWFWLMPVITVLFTGAWLAEFSRYRALNESNAPVRRFEKYPSVFILICVIFVLSAGKLPWLMPVVTVLFIGVWLAEFSRYRALNASNAPVRRFEKYPSIFILICVIDAAIFSFAVWALYLPIFRLGSVI